MIVLNEREYAERWLEKDVPWKRVGHVLHFVAKLYFSKGYSKEDVRVKLNEYMLDFPFYNSLYDSIVQNSGSCKPGMYASPLSLISRNWRLTSKHV